VEGENGTVESWPPKWSEGRVTSHDATLCAYSPKCWEGVLGSSSPHLATPKQHQRSLIWGIRLAPRRLDT
jgi:hypothetical protein